jgi:hypothetical protein
LFLGRVVLTMGLLALAIWLLIWLVMRAQGAG